MAIIQFTIHGTHKGTEYNPLPKLKMTGKQFWTPRAREYVLWKQHVRASFLVACKDAGHLNNRELRDHLYVLDGKPIKKSVAAGRMDIKITWSSEVHGDPENIFGSIADALFENDKHLAGSFQYNHSPDKKARVDVTITI